MSPVQSDRIVCAGLRLVEVVGFEVRGGAVSMHRGVGGVHLEAALVALNGSLHIPRTKQRVASLLLPLCFSAHRLTVRWLEHGLNRVRFRVFWSFGILRLAVAFLNHQPPPIGRGGGRRRGGHIDRQGRGTCRLPVAVAVLLLLNHQTSALFVAGSRTVTFPVLGGRLSPLPVNASLRARLARLGTGSRRAGGAMGQQGLQLPHLTKHVWIVREGAQEGAVVAKRVFCATKDTARLGATEDCSQILPVQLLRLCVCLPLLLLVLLLLRRIYGASLLLVIR
mmetsp:Transcript_1142/g.2367  ORF Transcript_1142/g.2367 Transcript_1142/m.2367 type:complete len:280 (-) Transcript_1142:2072-2911(-)